MSTFWEVHVIDINTHCNGVTVGIEGKFECSGELASIKFLMLVTNEYHNDSLIDKWFNHITVGFRGVSGWACHVIEDSSSNRVEDDIVILEM